MSGTTSKSSGTCRKTNQVTILINGEVLGGGPFASAVTVDPDCPTVDVPVSLTVLNVPSGASVTTARSFRLARTTSTTSYFIRIRPEQPSNSRTISRTTALATRSPAPWITPIQSMPFVSVFDRSSGGGNTPAVFFNLVGAINSDDTNVLMDMVTIIDPDPGEDLAVEQNGTATTVWNVFDSVVRYVGIHTRYDESDDCSDGSGRQADGHHSDFVG